MNASNHCGAMLEHIQQEHHRLNAALLQIRHRLAHSLADGKANPVAAEIVTLLEKLRAELVMHFADEESGGCFEEVATRCPSLIPQIKAIKADHLELISKLNELLADAKNQVTAHERIHAEFEAFFRQLHEHEAAETRLLQYAFGSEAADFDVEGNE